MAVHDLTSAGNRAIDDFELQDPAELICCSDKQKAPRETAGFLFEIREEDEAFRSWQTWQQPILPSRET
jgi:hypothetical protein